jgi:uncharacterized membrane protein
MTFLTLQHSIRWTFLLHALCGAVALGIFLIPLFSKKGKKLHIKTGWAYIYAMLIVCVSAFVITPWRIFFDENRTKQTQGFSTFLFFIAIFTLSTIYFGVVALKSKQRVKPSRKLIHIGPPIFLIALGLMTQAVGLKLGNTLLIIFPFLAHLTAKSHLTYWLTAPTFKRHWWYAHMSGMGTACIATVTAFLVTALPRIWPSPLMNSPLLWVAPGIIGGALLKRATARYQLQFGDTP